MGEVRGETGMLTLHLNGKGGGAMLFKNVASPTTF